MLGRIAATTALHPTQVSGAPALLVRQGDEIGTVLTLRVDDGRVTGLHAVRNPEKLSHLERGTTLSR
ncbi:hypothetical protein [Streptomyces sp. NPDC127098]|uniref:hypothetical protein n=1 Tax=Streptomyces sp. NPDC127098 TaxID=3347137 RepID=UPI00366132EB